MGDPYASTLSLTPVAKPWREVMTLAYAYLNEHHRFEAALPTRGILQLVDPREHAIRDTSMMEVSWMPSQAPPEGMTYWYGFEEYLSILNWDGGFTLSLRSVSERETHIELWLPTKLHEYIYAFNVSKSFNPEVKAELLRLFVGITKAVGAAGFGYQIAKGDTVFGALSVDTLRDFIEVELYLSTKKPLPLELAGLSCAVVEENRFEYDFEEEPVHYRHNGFYIFDVLYPTDY